MPTDHVIGRPKTPLRTFNSTLVDHHRLGCSPRHYLCYESSACLLAVTISSWTTPEPGLQLEPGLRWHPKVGNRMRALAASSAFGAVPIPSFIAVPLRRTERQGEHLYAMFSYGAASVGGCPVSGSSLGVRLWSTSQRLTRRYLSERGGVISVLGTSCFRSSVQM